MANATTGSLCQSISGSRRLNVKLFRVTSIPMPPHRHWGSEEPRNIKIAKSESKTHMGEWLQVAFMLVFHLLH